MKDWKTKYDTHLINGDFDLATKIKDNNFKNRLFKYRCFDNENNWKDWIKGTIFVNSPSSFNDPYNCMINIASETRTEMIRKVYCSKNCHFF